jgi:hypothetical protein
MNPSSAKGQLTKESRRTEFYRKIPENVLQEDPKPLMWYENAVTRVGKG